MGTAEIPITRRHYASKALLEAGLIVNQEWGYVEGADHIGILLSDGTYRYHSRTELFPPGAGVVAAIEVAANADIIQNTSKTGELKYHFENTHATGACVLEMKGNAANATRLIHDNTNDMVSLEYGENELRFRDRGVAQYVKLTQSGGDQQINTGGTGTPDLILGANGTDVLTIVGATKDLYTVPWTDYSGDVTLTGFVGAGTINWYKYKQIGKFVYVIFDVEGTSDDTVFRMTIPIPAKADLLHIFTCTGYNGNNGIDGGIKGNIGQNAPTDVDFDITQAYVHAAASWQNSNSKGARGQFFYEAA